MTWFFLRNRETQGPLADEAFEAAVRSGGIGRGTLVWNEGMAGWEPLGSARPDLAALCPAAPPLAGGPETERTCSGCKRPFPVQDVIGYSTFTICASCKPAFLLRLQQGLPPAGSVPYASFGARFTARTVDGLGLLVVSFAAQFPLVGFPVLAPVLPDAPGFWARQGVAFLVGLLIPAAYTIGLHGRDGQTLGKKLLGIRVVRADGSQLTYGRATGRYFADMLSSMTLFVGYLMAAFDDERRALHDRLCDTRVVQLP